MPHFELQKVISGFYLGTRNAILFVRKRPLFCKISRFHIPNSGTSIAKIKILWPPLQFKKSLNIAKDTCTWLMSISFQISYLCSFQSHFDFLAVGCRSVDFALSRSQSPMPFSNWDVPVIVLVRQFSSWKISEVHGTQWSWLPSYSLSSLPSSSSRWTYSWPSRPIAPQSACTSVSGLPQPNQCFSEWLSDHTEGLMTQKWHFKIIQFEVLIFANMQHGQLPS